MTRPPSGGRFALASALAAVFGLAIAFAALRKPTALWCNIALILTWAVMLWGTLGTIVLRGSHRLPPLGVALFGWFFFLMTLNSVSRDYEVWMTPGFRHTAEGIFPVPPAPSPTGKSDADFAQAMLDHGVEVERVEDQYRHFAIISVLLCNLLFALAGGLAGRSFACRRNSMATTVRPSHERAA